MGLVPAVQFRLQAIALGQQRQVPRRQVMDQRVEALPERRAVDAGAGQHLVLDEAVQRRGHFEAVGGGAGSHGGSLADVKGDRACARRPPLYLILASRFSPARVN
jgi:hypothetical protein